MSNKDELSIKMDNEDRSYTLNQKETSILLGRIVRETEVDYITFEGNKYYQHHTGWYGYGKPKSGIECDGDDSHDYEYLEYMERNPPLYINEEEALEHMTINVLPEIVEKVMQEKDCDDWMALREIILEHEEIILPTNVVARNGSGPNNDHRGSDHMDIVVPMCQYVYIRKGIFNIMEVASTLAKLKSHHFDNNYEGLWDCYICNEQKYPFFQSEWDLEELKYVEDIIGKNYWKMNIFGYHGS